MLNEFRQIIGAETEYVEVGTVEKRKGEGRFDVTVRDKIFTVRAAIGQPLFVGDVVIVNKTNIGRYIVGVAQTKKSSQHRVFVVEG